MALADEVSSRTDHADARQRCLAVREALTRAKLFSETVTDSAAATRWRVSPEPVLLSLEQLHFFETLGTKLLAFYRALNRLYFESVHGTQPPWVAAYLDQGKPDSLITYSRLARFRDLLPDVIRPDVIPTDTGMIITELDSVPGGIGLTACMAQAYGATSDALRVTRDENTATTHHSSPITCHPFNIVGGADGMVRGFASMLRERMEGRTGGVAIVVSEEAQDYRPEMEWMAARLREQDLAVFCVDARSPSSIASSNCSISPTSPNPN